MYPGLSDADAAAVVADAGGVRARDRAHGDPPLRVRRDKHSSPCERPERERSELEDEGRQEEAPVEPAEAIGCGLEDVGERPRDVHPRLPPVP